MWLASISQATNQSRDHGDQCLTIATEWALSLSVGPASSRCACYSTTGNSLTARRSERKCSGNLLLLWTVRVIDLSRVTLTSTSKDY